MISTSTTITDLKGASGRTKLPRVKVVGVAWLKATPVLLAWSILAACSPPAEAAPRSRSGRRSLTSATTEAVRPTGRAAPAPAARFLDVGEIRSAMRRARGQVLFVHLWASWCGPCLEELPVIDRFARTARARGATVLSLSLDKDPRSIARVPAVLRTRAPSLSSFVASFPDPDQFMSLFSRAWEGSIPAIFAFDRVGRLQASLIGEVEPGELDSLLARMSRPRRRHL